MTRFARGVLGLNVSFQDAATMEFTTLEGDALEVMGPGESYFDFGRQARGPVPLFEVADVHSAAELRAAGVELVGPPGVGRKWHWIHVRAPDGHLYEMASPRESR